MAENNAPPQGGNESGDPADPAAPQETATIPASSQGVLPIVGIGGSAGSIPALQTFFKQTKADTGMAYVVVLHLSTEHESTLAPILQRSTSMPVTQVKGRTKVELNRVYVIPPAKQLSMQDGHLELSELDRTPGKRVAVDLFFRTLADTHGPRARSIVLSGADSDGAIGVKRIKEMGGLTVVQDPNEAQFEGMPRAAIATGLIDWVLPVAEMPARLAAYHENETRVRLPSLNAPDVENAHVAESADEAALRAILIFLRESTGRDFAYYKRATVLRRLARRMQVCSVLELPEYLEYLRHHPGEAGALLQDLLISVTNFFRDRPAFQMLEANIPRLFEGRKATDQIRVWVAGCATGEEAYSIAMLLSEHAARQPAPPRFQVFATDIDENAVNAARTGTYPLAIAADVSEDRLRRFFTKEHQAYQVKRSLRETVLFALHDLLKDFPFSRIDLISCRNLLIYLDRSAQTRALEIFHFALRPEGRLFLASSESAEEGGSLFYALEKKQRLYGRAAVPRATLPPFVESIPSAWATRLDRGVSLPSFTPADSGLLPKVPDPLVPSRSTDGSWAELHLKLIEEIAEPSLIVDPSYDVVHLSKGAGQFLRFAGGEPSKNLLRLVNPALRTELRTALFRAGQAPGVVEVPGVPLELEGENSVVHLSVRSIQGSAPGHFLISFQGPSSGEPSPPPVLTPITTRLEEELEQTKRQLRETVDQYEIGAEELKASNEELQAINEELRSATEELETSREELQSINEELITVNQELKSKVEEVSRTNSDLHNLMSSTNIATIFLDRELQISRYTPTAVPLFNLIHSDIGRPLSDLQARFDYPSLSDDAARVLEHLALIEREVCSADGRWFLVRLLPYRTTEDHIAGVVLTFVDITRRKEMEEALRQSEKNLSEELKAIGDLHEMTIRLLNTADLPATLQEVLAAVIGLNETEMGCVHLFDAASQKLKLVSTTGLAPGFTEMYGVIAPGGDSPFSKALASRKRLVVADQESDVKVVAPNALKQGYRAIYITPLLTREGELLGLMTIFFHDPHRPTQRDIQRTELYTRQASDLIERKRSEGALRESGESIKAILSQTTVGIGQLDLLGRILFANGKLCEILGVNAAALSGRDVRTLVNPEDWEEGERLYHHLRNGGRPYELERRLLHKDGTVSWVSAGITIVRDAKADPHSVVVSVADITQPHEVQTQLKAALEENQKTRAETEAAVVAKDQFLAILSHELRTPLTPVLVTLGSLSRRTDLPPRVREGLEMIERNVQVEAHFIDDLLDVTRITRNKFEIVTKEMDVHEALRHAVEISEADILAKKQRLIVELDARKHAISGDAARIQQIFWNVLKNSSKFSPDGAEIRIKTCNKGRDIEVVITDDGVGIDPKVLPHIFDPFIQGGEASSREFGGLGLGLAISKATMDAHGGTLRAESEGRGRGATFTVTLPLLNP